MLVNVQNFNCQSLDNISQWKITLVKGSNELVLLTLFGIFQELPIKELKA